jgi:hypothetical protein
MPQNFKRFEQRRLQRAVLPGGLFHHRLEQFALLGGGLLEEQLTGPTRQAKHVDGLIDRGGGGLLDVLDLASRRGPEEGLIVPAEDLLQP